MNEFHENRFHKDTKVVPFFNASEFEFWRHNNCARCINYQKTSDNKKNVKCKFAFYLDYGTILIEKEKCKLAFFLDYGSIIGTIPLWVAKGIGCDYNPLYQSCKLRSRCKEMRKVDAPF